ncbi:hypothetical protein [Dechloromonas sp. A34]|uniref:hypothetical protein n=1 Tax=Dechloromonas sp. A34 TaxID=447588 RepID=UPI002248A03B|nr:hypothetical protein [Dechloromonas sp. A34]
MADPLGKDIPQENEIVQSQHGRRSRLNHIDGGHYGIVEKLLRGMAGITAVYAVIIMAREMGIQISFR